MRTFSDQPLSGSPLDGQALFWMTGLLNLYLQNAPTMSLVVPEAHQQFQVRISFTVVLALTYDLYSTFSVCSTLMWTESARLCTL